MNPALHQIGNTKSSFGSREPERESEGGYTLVALLALMTIMMIMMMAVAPSIQQQVQREKENEAIFRGEEVAEAISLYVHSHNGQLPTSMDQLLEGAPQGTKKKQILRAEAVRDPLTNGGEWRLVGPTDPEILQFQVAVADYAGAVTPPTHDPLFQRYVAQITSLTNLGSKDTAPLSSISGDDASNSPKPFIGITSRSKRDAVITYYGIERHNKWVFTPLFR